MGSHFRAQIVSDMLRKLSKLPGLGQNLGFSDAFEVSDETTDFNACSWSAHIYMLDDAMDNAGVLRPCAISSLQGLHVCIEMRGIAPTRKSMRQLLNLT